MSLKVVVVVFVIVFVVVVVVGTHSKNLKIGLVVLKKGGTFVQTRINQFS